MLSKVLAYLKAGGDARVTTIARKLDIDEGTVEMLLDQLVKLGYLEIIPPEESSSDCPVEKCSSCPLASNCETFLKAKYILVKKER